MITYIKSCYAISLSESLFVDEFDVDSLSVSLSSFLLFEHVLLRHIKSSKLWLIIFFLPRSGPVGLLPFDGLSYLNYNTITDVSLLYKLFERL